jgi:hypothetical protein
MDEFLNFQTTVNQSSQDLYAGLYELSAFKMFAIISSILNVVFFTPLFYSIIWYEKYCLGIHRTLINQLVSSCCWVAICYNTFVQIPEVIFSFVGVAPEIALPTGNGSTWYVDHLVQFTTAIHISC